VLDGIHPCVENTDNVDVVGPYLVEDKVISCGETHESRPYIVSGFSQSGIVGKQFYPRLQQKDVCIFLFFSPLPEGVKTNLT
jgi:hypothetical protein